MSKAKTLAVQVVAPFLFDGKVRNPSADPKKPATLSLPRRVALDLVQRGRVVLAELKAAASAEVAPA